MPNKKTDLLFSPLQNRKGVSAVMVVILLPVLIGFAALAIDVGYMYATKGELQNVADAAALAGAGELGRIYRDNGEHDPSDDQQIKDAAKFLLVPEEDRNKAAGKSITPIDDDIEIGVWKNGSFETYDVTVADKYPPDAVRVIARTQGPVSTFFAKILNFFSFEVTALATAALSGPSIIEEGQVNVPIGLSQNLFPDKCGEVISFSGTKDSCAGWHNFFSATNTNSIRRNLLEIIAGHEVTDQKILDELADLNLGSEAFENGLDWLEHYYKEAWDKAKQTLKIDENGVVIGDININDPDSNTFNFTGAEGPFLNTNDIILQWPENTPNLGGQPINSGSITTFPALFDYFRMRDGDGDPSKWTAVLPVYEDDPGCKNPTGSLAIVGFAIVEILGYSGPSPNEVYVNLDCDMFELSAGRGGGANYGNLKGSIPNLVE